MQLLDTHLWELYSKGWISAEEAVDKCKDAGAFSEKIHRSGGTVGRAELDEAHDAT